ncbi:Taste receptor type 1 member 1 [Oryzias melastigma]|uniref:Taste receptor type 1 member 1 n=1 Tax=Oryzias melastigma TaxID=30732 RepID=A0A834FJV4_ORYME|nr:Taste receptor type 1 member 1 [Oryzias melastigma]
MSLQLIFRDRKPSTAPVHPNKDVINAIVGIIQNFSWRWVAFLNSDDDFGKDGLEQFKARIEESDICLAYYKSINHDTDYSQVFKQLEEQNIKILEELKKSNFTLLNQTVQFDENGDPKFGSLSIVFWNHSGEAEEVGFYNFQQSTHLSINKTKIKWFTNGEVPTALCSSECPAGYAKKPNGIHKCCFSCEICKTKTYINITENPFRCISCKDTEWSAEGSTSCTPRLLEYVLFTDSGAMLTMVLEGLLLDSSSQKNRKFQPSAR